MPDVWVLKLLSGVGSVASMYSVIDALVRQRSDCSAEELFARCFKDVVAMRREQLAAHTEDGDPAGVEVDENRLSQAMANAAQVVAGLQTQNLPSRIRAAAPAFRHVVVLPGFPGADEDLDEIAVDILLRALAEFSERLPTTPVAWREVMLHGETQRREQAGATAEQTDEIIAVLDEIREAVGSLTEDVALPPERLLSEASRLERRNPFRLVRAEEFNHDYRKLAEAFHQPEAYDRIAGRRPVLLIGGRGSGKSMILRCLSVAAQVERERERLQNPAAKYADTELDYFGVYVKLAEGFFSPVRPEVGLDLEVMRNFFQHYLNMSLTNALLTTLQRCKASGILDISETEESSVCNAIARLIKPGETAPSSSGVRDLALHQQH